MPEINIPKGSIDSAPWHAIRTDPLEPSTPVHEQVLRDALAGVELGAYDETIVEWLAVRDTAMVATIASLIYRVRALGYEGPEVAE
jgi:hypothetical protein